MRRAGCALYQAPRSWRRHSATSASLHTAPPSPTSTRVDHGSCDREGVAAPPSRNATLSRPQLLSLSSPSFSFSLRSLIDSRCIYLGSHLCIVLPSPNCLDPFAFLPDTHRSPEPTFWGVCFILIPRLHSLCPLLDLRDCTCSAAAAATTKKKKNNRPGNQPTHDNRPAVRCPCLLFSLVVQAKSRLFPASRLHAPSPIPSLCSSTPNNGVAASLMRLR